MTTIGWRLPKRLDFETWQGQGARVCQIEGAVQWWLGDWANAGEDAFGEDYAQAMEATGYQQQTIYNAAYVCRAFPYERRRPRLSYSHHKALAGREPDVQERWLDYCERERVTSKDLATQLRAEAESDNRRALAAQTQDHANGKLPAAGNTARGGLHAPDGGADQTDAPEPEKGATVRSATDPAESDDFGVAPAVTVVDAVIDAMIETPEPSSMRTAFATVQGKPERVVDALDRIRGNVVGALGEQPWLDAYLGWMSERLFAGDPPSLADIFAAGYDAGFHA